MSDDDQTTEEGKRKRSRAVVPTRAVTLLVPDAANDEDDDGPEVPPPPGRRDDEHVAPGARNTVNLFPNLGARGAIPDHLAIHRIDPPHGFVGRAPIDATEEHLADRFGGRSLRITVMTAEGKAIRGGVRTLTIEREPILPNDPLRAPRAITGVPEGQADLERRLVAMAHEQETRLAILKAEAEERERKSIREAEERERKAQREHQAYLERMKTEHQQALDRMRAEAKADAERSANTAKEMVAIIQASASSQVALLTESHKSNVEMMTRVFSAQAQQAANNRPADPMEAVKLGLQMASQFGALGGGKDDAEGALSKLVDVARDGFKAMQSAGPRLPPPRNARALPAATAQRNGSTGAGDATAPNTKQARVKTKLADILRGLEGQGYDVETVLDQLAAQLPGVEPAPAAAPAPPAPEPAPAPAPAAAEPVDDSPSLDDFTG